MSCLGDEIVYGLTAVGVTEHYGRLRYFLLARWPMRVPVKFAVDLDCVQWCPAATVVAVSWAGLIRSESPGLSYINPWHRPGAQLMVQPSDGSGGLPVVRETAISSAT